MHAGLERRVAYVSRAGGPDVLELTSERIQPLTAGHTLIHVEAIGLNHAETLVRSGTYAVRFPFPYPAGFEGAGTVVEAAPDVSIPEGTRVCWTGVFGSCATFVTAPATMLATIPDGLTFEQGASLAHAGITAQLLSRVWPLDQSTAVVWGAAGSVGRMLVAILADRGVQVIGIASGSRIETVKRAGAALAVDRDHAVDRALDDVVAAVRNYTGGRGAAAVFDPVAAATFDTSLEMLEPRGCLINYGELSGPVPSIDLHRLFERSVFLTKFNGRAYVREGETVAGFIDEALKMALNRPAVISEIAGRFPLEQTSEAYRALESNPQGKVLVVPTL
jgi:NADPH:quinone reductase